MIEMNKIRIDFYYIFCVLFDAWFIELMVNGKENLNVYSLIAWMTGFEWTY